MMFGAFVLDFDRVFKIQNKQNLHRRENQWVSQTLSISTHARESTSKKKKREALSKLFGDKKPFMLLR